MPVKAKRLVGIRIVVGAEESLADDLLQLLRLASFLLRIHWLSGEISLLVGIDYGCFQL